MMTAAKQAFNQRLKNLQKNMTDGHVQNHELKSDNNANRYDEEEKNEDYELK